MIVFKIIESLQCILKDTSPMIAERSSKNSEFD